jgi:hypothetical protein
MVPCDSILGSILPVTEEMRERHRKVMAEGNEDMWEGSSDEDEEKEVEQKSSVLLDNDQGNDDGMWGSDSSESEEPEEPAKKRSRRGRSV